MIAKDFCNVAVREQFECGVVPGVCHWRWMYGPPADDQIIRRKPIHESCTHVIWDGDAKEMDNLMPSAHDNSHSGCYGGKKFAED
ncbi:portal protein [Shigella flexneri]